MYMPSSFLAQLMQGPGQDDELRIAPPVNIQDLAPRNLREDQGWLNQPPVDQIQPSPLPPFAPRPQQANATPQAPEGGWGSNAPSTPPPQALVQQLNSMQYSNPQTLPNGVQTRDVQFETPQSQAARQSNPNLPQIFTPNQPDIERFRAEEGISNDPMERIYGRPAPPQAPRPEDFYFGPTGHVQDRTWRPGGFDAGGFAAATQGHTTRQNALLEAMTRGAANQTNRDIHFGTNGVPGTIRAGLDAARLHGDALRDVAGINANATDRGAHSPDAANEANYRAFMQAELQRDPTRTMADVQRRWVDSGGTLPRSQGGASLSQPSGQTAPSQAGAGPLAGPGPWRQSQTTTGGTGGPGVAGPVAPGPGPVVPGNNTTRPVNPLTTMENTLDAILRPTGSPQARAPGRDDIARFIHALPPGIADSNIRELQRFMIQRFGENALNPWSIARGDSSSDERARRIIRDAVNRAQPGTVGTSHLNEETGALPWVLNALFRPDRVYRATR